MKSRRRTTLLKAASVRPGAHLLVVQPSHREIANFKVFFLLLVSFFNKGYELTGQEAVKLDQELQVDIVALGGLTVSALDVVAVEIDTWKLETVSARWFMLKCGCSSSRKRASRSQRRYTRYHHHSHTQAMHISSFTYPWRRLVLKSLMMGLKVEVENVWEYRRTFQPKISGLSISIGALIGQQLD
jgi:hypothetical protein